MLPRLEQGALLGARALSFIGLIGLLLLALMTLADGLLRWLLNSPIEGVRDVGGLMIAVAVSCCLPMALMERSNITVRVFDQRFPRLARALDFCAAVLVEIVLLAMTWQFFLYANKLAHARETTWVLQIPTAPFWYGVGLIIACATGVQAVGVVIEGARLFRPIGRRSISLSPTASGAKE